MRQMLQPTFASVVMLVAMTLAAAVHADDFAGLVSRQPGTAQPGPASAGDVVVVDIDRDVAWALAASTHRVTLRHLPIDGARDADFSLDRFTVLAPDATIVEFDGTTATPLAAPPMSAFRGPSTTNPALELTLAILPSGEIVAVVTEDDAVVALIGPDEKSGHVLLDAEALVPSDTGTFCDTQNDPNSEQPAPSVPAPAPRLASDALIELDVLVDVSYGLRQARFGGNSQAAAAYAQAVFAAVSSIYRRDVKLAPRITTLVIWTTTEPFTGTNTEQQLNAYRSYNNQHRTDVTRHLAHYLAGGQNFGGIANYAGICGNGAYAVSNIHGTYTLPAPGFIWDVKVVAHEIGHNLNSRHTHCYNPPLDHCHNQEFGCYSGPVTPQVGEIMSYCHLVATVRLGFSGPTGAVMRRTAEFASCTGPKAAVCGDGVLDEGEQCDDGNLDDDDCCSATCMLLSSDTHTCDDGEYCTIRYFCTDGSCLQQPRDCSDGNPCTIDYCDEQLNACVHYDRNGIVCDDGVFCTHPDRCSAGVCGGPPRNCSDGNACISSICNEDEATCVPGAAQPLDSCRSAGKSKFFLRHGRKPTQTAMKWDWTRGEATYAEDFDDPGSDTNYSLCLFDDTGSLVSAFHVPSVSRCNGYRCWQSKGEGRTWIYRHRAAIPNGVTNARLSSGIAGRAKMSVKGKGALLENPPLPLAPNASLRLQLRNDRNEHCWESVLAPPFRRHDAQQLRAQD